MAVKDFKRGQNLTFKKLLMHHVKDYLLIEMKINLK